MTPQVSDVLLFRLTRRATWVGWAGTALLLTTAGLFVTSRSAGTAAAAYRRAFDSELTACQHRLVKGYTTSGIRVSADDASTIQAACQRAVQERLNRPDKAR
ncbi:hypothetical protein DAETH_48880 (plasmid) [Deinococcus aetherius]|uniref:Secreted protein n=1 Tax=Deinococcus aetherius TaxID=200252 RepID=A0ABM8AM53_9DEIO|nr:hypothetical protein DAETH_48880 [Deinococcus aetherius]